MILKDITLPRFTMKLIIDIGNSRTKLFVFDEEKIVYSTTIDNSQLGELSLPNVHCIDTGIICNVSNVENASITNQFSNVKFTIFTHETPIPIQIRYKTHQTLGLDRIAAAVGATSISSNTNKLVIDLGTAITIDFVNKDNEFVGGNISLGMHSRFRALHEFTGKLPLCSAQETTTLTGQDTFEAIQNGVILGICHEVDGYIDSYSSLYQNLTTFLTGGDCLFFEKRLKNHIFAQQNLVALGLYTILKYNEE